MRRASGALFFGLAALLLTACFARPLWALSLDDEKAMGEAFMAQVHGQFAFLDDDFAVQYFNELGQFLGRGMEPRYFPLHFYILKEGSLNAFAGPGGHICVFTGLIDALDSIDELAAVTSHEIGHIAARHLAQRMEQGKKIGIATMAGLIAGILIGGPVAQALLAGATAASIQAQLAFSRDDERQADQLSYKFMGPTGLEPAGMVTALQKIERGSYLGSDKVPTYLLTHPKGPERMSNLEAMIKGYRPPEEVSKEALRLRELYPYFRTVVQARSLDPKDAKRLFQGELQRNPDSDVAAFGMGLSLIQESDYTLAIPYLRAARDKNPDFSPILSSLGEAYAMNGENARAVSLLEEAVREDDKDRGALYNLAMAYENMERYDKAIVFFEKLTYLPSPRPEAIYHLGLCYGRVNRLGPAHYYFALYNKGVGDLQKAQFHLKKAEDLARGDPALAAKVKALKAGLDPKKKEE